MSHGFLIAQPVDEGMGNGGAPVFEGFEAVGALRPCAGHRVLLLRQRLPGKVRQNLACGAVLAACAFLDREQDVIIQ